MLATTANPGTTGGNREYLKDVLTILEPEETPYISMVNKGESPAGSYIEVLASQLRKPRTTGTREGLDASKMNNKAKNRKRFGTYLHRSQDEYGCTDVQQAISERGGVAAVNSEFEADKAQTMREVKRDIEAACCSANEHVNGNGGDAEMLTRGNFCWLDKQGGTLQTTNPVPTEFLLIDAATASDGVGQYRSGITAVTEDQLNIACQALARVHGGKREFQCIAGDIFVKTVDNFTRVNSSTTNARYTVREMADEHQITLMVKVFESSFARVNILPTQFNKVGATGTGDPYAAQILYMDLWEVDFLEELHAKDEEPNAGGKNGYVKAIFANLCKMPKGNANIFNT
jgi:hypothetical protein